MTFVTSHDSQPLQSLESVIEPRFVPSACAAILLRHDGYPCLFYPDYYGAEYEDKGGGGQSHKAVTASHRVLIDTFLAARRDHAHGEQVEYLDHWNRVGWVRLGTEAHPKALAVPMSDGPEGSKWMRVDRPEGTTFRDRTDHVESAAAIARCRFGSSSDGDLVSPTRKRGEQIRGESPVGEDKTAATRGRGAFGFAPLACASG